MDLKSAVYFVASLKVVDFGFICGKSVRCFFVARFWHLPCRVLCVSARLVVWPKEPWLLTAHFKGILDRGFSDSILFKWEKNIPSN